jgi:hypothetical protein
MSDAFPAHLNRGQRQPAVATLVILQAFAIWSDYLLDPATHFPCVSVRDILAHAVMASTATACNGEK